MKGIYSMKDSTKIIEKAVEKVGLTWRDAEFHICNEIIAIRQNDLYLDTRKIATETEKLEEVINKLKEELKKNFEIVAEETLYSFIVITLKQK